MDKCSIEGCTGKYHAKGLCGKHYGYKLNHGRILEKSPYDPRPAVMEYGVAKIPVGPDGRDGCALVDEEDAWVADKKWYKHTNGYVVNAAGGGQIYLHRLVMGAKPGQEIDHLSRDKFDNRKSNLRFVDRSENMHNSGMRVDNKSGHRGVWYDGTRDKWCATLWVEGRVMHRSRHPSKAAAISAYEKARRDMV